MSILNPAALHRSAHLTHFHAGHASGVAVLTWERRGDELRPVRVLRSPDGFAQESSEPNSDPSQTLIYEGSEGHCTVIDDRVEDDAAYYYTVFVQADDGTWHREIRATVTIEGSIHWKRAGVESEGESADRFRTMWTDLDALG